MTATATEGTAVTENGRQRMSDADLVTLMGLIKGAKTVELKLTIPDDARYTTLQSLEVDPLDAEIRQVMFFDTPDLALNQAGVVVRARRVQVKGGDTVIKLRPVVPDQLPPDIRNLPNVGVEVDAMPGGYVCSASYKGQADDVNIKAVMAGQHPVRKLFSKEQRAFYTTHAPTGLALDGLAMLGPITVFKLKFNPKGFSRKMVAELWNYPNGQRLLELSTKCAPNETFQVVAEVRAFLHNRGISTGSVQQTKTKTALDYYSNLLKTSKT
ncbi:MAG TPA: hypothetical protein VFV93_14445 [Thermomicrobiales bacterium]|nr:hypothetical protein [Thermomicrobiales bacterium]